MKSLRPSDALEHISETAIAESATNLIPANTLIVATRIALGRAMRPTVACAINQDLKALIVGKGVDPDFLLYWIGANEGVIQDLGSGTTVSGIRLEALNGLQLLLPPSAEQTRIVEKLEELLSDLDAGVAELKAAQKKLAQYRQSLLKAAVEGALTAAWRQSPAAQNAESGADLLQRILRERRARWEARQLAKFKEQGKTPPKDWQAKYPEPVAPDTTGLPELPQGWVWASVEQLGDVQLGRQRSPDKLAGLSPTLYIRAANITESGVDLTDVLAMDFSEGEKETFRLAVGDVLLTEASGSPEHVGRPAVWRHADGLFCFQNTVLRFRPNSISTDFAFLSFLAMQKLGVFRKLSSGVGINHLSAGKFSKLPVALPPVDEQLALVAILEDALMQCDAQTTEIELSLRRSAAQRKNILQAAFSGQLVPQDPNDEPASAVLERIRSERAQRTATTPPRRKIKKIA